MDDPRDDQSDRFGRLFEELEGEFAAELRLEDEQGATQALRAQLGATVLWEHLARRVGWQVVIRVPGRVLHGTLVASYVDFCAVQAEGAPPIWSASARVCPSACRPARTGAAAGPSPSRTAVPMGLALRELARRREPVMAVLVDGSEVGGTIEVVGQDYVEVAEHDPGEARRETAVRARRVLPMETLTLVSPPADLR